MSENEISRILVDVFIKIHKTLGPGLLESVYEEVVGIELNSNGLKYERQKEIIPTYDGHKLSIGFRADFIVEDKIIVELKSVQELLPVHAKQLLTYLKLSDLKLGLLVNFNVELMKNGIHRVVNNL